MITALWSISNIRASATLARWQADFVFQDVIAVYELRTGVIFRRFNETASLSESASVQPSASKEESFSFSDKTVIQATKGALESALLQESIGYLIEKSLSDDLLITESTVVASATNRSQSDAVGVTDTLLSFLSAGLGGSKFNEADINSFTFNE